MSNTTPRPSPTPKLISFDSLKDCGVDCAKEGLVKCNITDASCMCKSESWLGIFSTCFKKTCPIQEFKYTAEKFKEVCSQEAAGGLSIPGAAFVAEIKLLANQNLPSTTSASTSTPTTFTTSTGSPSETPGLFTPTPTSTSASDELGNGGVAGVAIGAAAGTLALILLGCYLYRRKKARANKPDAYTNAPNFCEQKDTEESYVQAPYTAHYAASSSTAPPTYSPLNGQQVIYEAPSPAHLPPTIPVLVEAADPASIQQMIYNRHRHF